jgi:hypothetical protein
MNPEYTEKMDDYLSSSSNSFLTPKEVSEDVE